MRRVILFCIALIWIIFLQSGNAHDARPVYLQIQEKESGQLLVQWKVPRALPVYAMPEPLLPEGCQKIGDRIVTEQPNAWLNKQLYRYDDTIAGKEVGLKYPMHNPSLSTLMRIELANGERYIQVLGPEEQVWQIPETDTDNLSLAMQYTLNGIKHIFQHWIHFPFILVLLFLGDFKQQIRFITAFTIGQIAAAIFIIFIPLQLSIAFAEAALALAVVWLSLEMIKPRTTKSQLMLIAAFTGLFHGASMAAVALQ